MQRRKTPRACSPTRATTHWQELRVVVSGFTSVLTLRKDAEGMLGIRCSNGPAPRGLQGANCWKGVAHG